MNPLVGGRTAEPARRGDAQQGVRLATGILQDAFSQNAFRAGTMEEGEAPATTAHHPPSDSSLGAFQCQWTSAIRVKGRPPFTRLFVIVWMHLELGLTSSEGSKNV